MKRPEKSWLGDDYFDSRNSEAHFDLIEILGGYGSSNPSLSETASVCGIPGKMGVSGEEVSPMWLGDVRPKFTPTTSVMH